MGYTHYWKIDEGFHFGLQHHYINAKQEISFLLKKIQQEKKIDLDITDGIDFKNGNGEISFNGIGENEHETFYMPENYTSIIKNPFNFCKTARKPYDIIVTSCLFIIKKHLGNVFKFSSDGYAKGKYCDKEMKNAFKFYNNFQKNITHNFSGIPITWYMEK